MRLFLFILLGLFCNTNLWPCTAFMFNNNSSFLFANNEDTTNPTALMHVIPGKQGQYGRIIFGYEDYSYQGGINEAGLCYDGFGVNHKPAPPEQKKPLYQGDLIEHILAECSLVSEVITLLTHYQMPWLENSQFFFADKTGDAVIVESGGLYRKNGSYQIATNFRNSETGKNEKPTFERFVIAENFLKDVPVSVDGARKVLAAVHQEEEPTLYSNIYDLQNGLIYLYWFHNYENEVVLSINEELKKGKQIIDISTLFPETAAWEHYLWKRKKDLEQIKVNRQDINFNPDLCEEYTGTYEISYEQFAQKIPDIAALLYQKPFRLNIIRKDNTLYFNHTLCPTLIELIPES